MLHKQGEQQMYNPSFSNLQLFFINYTVLTGGVHLQLASSAEPDMAPHAMTGMYLRDGRPCVQVVCAAC